MFKKLFLALALIASATSKSETDSPRPFVHYKNPFVWIYGAGAASGLMALYTQYVAEYPVDPYFSKKRELDTVIYAFISGALIIGTTAGIALAKAVNYMREDSNPSPEKSIQILRHQTATQAQMPIDK